MTKADALLLISKIRLKAYMLYPHSQDYESGLCCLADTLSVTLKGTLTFKTSTLLMQPLLNNAICGKQD